MRVLGNSVPCKLLNSSTKKETNMIFRYQINIVGLIHYVKRLFSARKSPLIRKLYKLSERRV